MKKIIYFLSVLTMFGTVGSAHAFTTKAQSAFLIDYDSDMVLVSKSADVLMPPSSMIKLMTLTVLFDAIKSGDLKLTDRMDVSENADYKNPVWQPASKICLVRGQTLTVRDAILGLIVQSGGDASVVVAERISGSESAFTDKMQQTARRIGMPLSTFGNASGLPNPGNFMTSRELATLASYIITAHSELYPLFATRRFEFGEYKADWCREWGRTHTLNYNKLLFNMPGAEGMKTGHTSEGGYGMVATARVGGRRLIGVINGFAAKNHEALASEMKKMLEHGYSTTFNREFYKAGAEIVKVPVWYGRKSTVVATVEKTFAVTLDKGQSMAGLRVVAHYDNPAVAPIIAGQKLGEIVAELNGQVIARAPLIAAERVNKTQFFGRIFKNLVVIFGGR